MISVTIEGDFNTIVDLVVSGQQSGVAQLAILGSYNVVQSLSLAVAATGRLTVQIGGSSNRLDGVEAFSSDASRVSVNVNGDRCSLSSASIGALEAGVTDVSVNAGSTATLLNLVAAGAGSLTYNLAPGAADTERIVKAIEVDQLVINVAVALIEAVLDVVATN